MEKPQKTSTDWAREFRDQNEPQGWMEALYQAAERDADQVPWADLAVNPGLAEWFAVNEIEGSGKRALVVGCGLGDDAEELLRLGFSVVGFDFSATAIQWCQERFPGSGAEYLQADLFDLPSEWVASFDLIIEIYTLQTMPEDMRARAMAIITGLLADNGTLLVICRGREPEDKLGNLPWPLSRSELRRFEQTGLVERRFSEYLETDHDPPIRRFQLEYTRADSTE